MLVTKAALRVVHYGANEDLSANVRATLPDAIAQEIVRRALNQHLSEGATEMHAWLKAYRALAAAGYARNESGNWVAIQKDSPAVGDVHVDRPLGSDKKRKPEHKDDNAGTQFVNPDDEDAKALFSKADEITVDVPLFIRLLEMAREEIKEDAPLHVLTEKITALMDSRKVLTMADYKQIVSVIKSNTFLKRISGNSNIPLNDKGQKLAERLGERLHLKGGLDVLHCSPLTRGKQTAAAIKAANPQTYEAKPDPGFQPWHLGGCEGKEPDDVHNLIAHYIENPDERPPGLGADGKPAETFGEAVHRQLDKFLSVYDDCEMHPNMKVGAVVHSRGMELLQSWVDAGMPKDFELDAKDLLQPHDPDHADVLRWHNGKIKEIDLDDDDELKPGFYLILHSLTDDDSDEGNKQLEKSDVADLKGVGESEVVQSQIVQKYLPPLEVQRAAKSAYDVGTAVLEITSVLADGQGLSQKDIERIAEHFGAVESYTESAVARNAWGGPLAGKWAGRVLKKVRTDEITKADAVIKSGNGVMLAFFPSNEVCHQLALPEGELPTQLHITLAYFGKQSEVTADQLEHIERAVKSFCNAYGPLEGQLQGPGRFPANAHTENCDVIIANLDSKAIQDFRRELVQNLTAEGVEPKNNFGYTPHLTLAYVAPDAPFPVHRVGPIPITFDEIILCVGGQRKPFALKGNVVKYSPDQPRDDNGRFGEGGGDVRFVDIKVGRVTGAEIGRIQEQVSQQSGLKGRAATARDIIYMMTTEDHLASASGKTAIVNQVASNEKGEMLGVMQGMTQHDQFYVDTLAVNPRILNGEMSAKGVGTRLMVEAAREASSGGRGLALTSLDVQSDKFYQALGMKEIKMKDFSRFEWSPEQVKAIAESGVKKSEGFDAEAAITAALAAEEENAPLASKPKDDDVQLAGQIIKLDGEHHVVFGWFSVIEVNGRPVEDTQGDIISEYNLELSAYDFVLNARVGGEMHEKEEESNEVRGVGRLIESVIFTKEKQRAMVASLEAQGIHGIVDLGCIAWWGGFYIEDDATWAKVTTGELRAWSIGGSGKRDKIGKYDPDQPRDDHGRWGSGGDTSGSGGTTYRATPSEKEINKLPVGDPARERVEAVRNEGKEWMKGVENNDPAFKDARETAAWAQGRMERVEKLMDTESRRLEKYNKMTEEQRQSPEGQKMFTQATKELDALQGRYMKAFNMLNESNKEIRERLGNWVKASVASGGPQIQGTVASIDDRQRAALEVHLNAFSQMVGGAPRGGSSHVYIESRSDTSRGYYSVGANMVTMPTGNTDRGLLFHEMGHWYEDQNKDVHLAALSYLDNRTYGAPTESMNKLTGKSGYSDTEVGRPDAFIEPYAGKIYSGGRATEVISMGFQHLAEDPAAFLKQDPDHFYFTLGAIRLGHK